jgi:hypothetical protein
MTTLRRFLRRPAVDRASRVESPHRELLWILGLMNVAPVASAVVSTAASTCRHGSPPINTAGRHGTAEHAIEPAKPLGIRSNPALSISARRFTAARPPV